MNEPGFNTMLVGATGSGKTYSLRTLLDAGLEVFILATEPGIASTLGDTDTSKMHWHYVAPAAPGLQSLMESAKKVNTMGMDMLSKLKDINKSKYSQFLDVLSTLANFTDDRTGQSYGSVEDWGTDRVIIVDSLSGLNIMAMDLVVGAKPVKSMSDWGISMDNLERLIMMLCTGVRASFVLTTHLEREQDEVSGAIQLMASTLGKKLAPRLPRFFDDVVQAKRTGTEFSWSTATLNVDLKARNLPISEKLTPSFKPIVTSWLSKGGAIQPTTVKKEEPKP